MPTEAKRAVPVAALALALLLPFSPSPVHAGEVLGVVLDQDEAGTLRVAVRGEEAPVVTIDETAASLTEKGRERTRRWQPLVVVADTTNVVPDGLEKIRRLIMQRAETRFADEGKVGTFRFPGESPLVVVADQAGALLQVNNADSVNTALKATVEGWRPAEAPDGGVVFSTLPDFLGKALASVQGGKSQPKALVFSSLCVGEEAKLPDLANFGGPVTFLTWDSGLDEKCSKGRESFLKQLEGKAEVVVLFKAETQDAVKTAVADLDLVDTVFTLAGHQYEGGNMALEVNVKGSESPWTTVLTETEMPDAWVAAATKRKAGRTRLRMMGALALLFIALIVAAFLKARGGAADMAKWEAVGEAEEMGSSMDPDAWNATIFQLTGVMPALQAAGEAAQIGPGATQPQKKPDDPPPADLGSHPSTGMTVSMPVLDDGTAYEADSAFEIGVLLEGKPVARKTKKFKKVFSIGRATDNRVVIQKDDTVHRYHVVIRPALEGREWWLEVSPTASNRTNLNGKDLRASGRYRLPERFRLQLGEATEVRGRLTTGA